MGLPQNEINYMRRQRSPTDVLLDTWGQKNHTVQELFVLLSRMEHYRAMRVLQEFSQCIFNDSLKIFNMYNNNNITIFLTMLF